VTILRLNNLHDNPGAVKKKRRVGRGIGCSKGKTCGRGHKGQKARSGGSIHPTFEGGQTKFYKLFPKRGFKNTRHETVMNGVNLGTIQTYIDMHRLDPEKPITVTALKDAGLFKPSAVKHGVKLLASGKEMLKQPLTIQLNRASASAVEAVEAFEGGSVQTVHYNKLALRTALRPEKFVDKYQPKHARPPPKWQPYYTSWHKRGYLNPAVQMRGWFEKQQQPDVTAIQLLLQLIWKASSKSCYRSARKSSP
jgi:large subunit ribosomal protein L15